jgi:4,5-dihydroxyphthalate decarboxylase
VFAAADILYTVGLVKLSIAVADRPHVRPLLDGEVSLVGYELEPVQRGPIIAAYRRMVRELAFDICELAPATFLMALEAGIPLCGIPIFLDRRFHHGDLICAAGSGITLAKQLEGRRVGVRAYSVTTGVWGRALLAHDYGVDLDTITWVVDDDDHLPVAARANIERVTGGSSLRELLLASRIDAAFSGNAGTGRAGSPRAGWDDARPNEADAGAEPYALFADADRIARDWHARTGIYPLHAIVAMRADLVEQDPELPTALFAAFARSKRAHLARDPHWEEVPHLRAQQRLVDGDPLPYGEQPNAQSLDALARFGRQQGLLAEERPGSRGWYAEGDYPPA